MTVAKVDILLEADWWRRTLEHDVRSGLSSIPRTISPKWFYDERGSELFDAITKLDEYYPFRREREILQRYATDIVAAADADTLVELGSGTSEKSRVLLDAMHGRGRLKGYVPFDVSEEMLRKAAAEIATDYPSIDVHGVVGDFERHLADLPISGTGMVAFLGSTIGNFEPAERAQFIGDVSSSLDPGGTFLLGTDLVKSAERLWAAYNDRQGVTAEFNLNLLTMLNRELGANFESAQFEHFAEWDSEQEWVDIRIRSKQAQKVNVTDLELTVEFAEGEDIHTEVSAKFRHEGIAAELGAAGLEVVNSWTDEASDYALTLARKP